MSTNLRLTIRKDDIKRYIQYLYDISGKPPTHVKDGKIKLDESYDNAIKKKYAKEEEKDEKKKEEKLTWDAIQRKIKEILNNKNFKGFIRTTKPFGNHVSGDVREKILEYNKHEPFGSDFSDEHVKDYKNEIIKYINSEGRWDDTDTDKRERYLNSLDNSKKYLDEEEANNNVDGLVSTIHSAMETFKNIANNTLDGVIVYKDLRDKFITLYPLFKEKFNSLSYDEEYYNNHKEAIDQINDYIRKIDNLTSLEKNDNYDPNDGKDYASDIELIDTDTILRGMPFEYKEENLDDIRKYAGKRLAIMTHVSDETYEDVAKDIYSSLEDKKYNRKKIPDIAKEYKDETEEYIKENESNREMDNYLYNKSKYFSSIGDFENIGFGMKRSIPHISESQRPSSDELLRSAMDKFANSEFIRSVYDGYGIPPPIEPGNESEEELPELENELAEQLKQETERLKQEEQPIEPEQLIEYEHPEDGQEESSEEEHQDEEHQDDEKQLELSESSESSTIEPVNEEEEELTEEEEHQEDENIHNEMSEDSDKEYVPSGGSLNFGGLTEPMNVLPINQSQQPSQNETPKLQEFIDAQKQLESVELPPAPVEASNTGVNSMNQDRNDIGHQLALIEAFNRSIQMIQYAQSSTDTNNILGGIVSIFKELPNGMDDEIANRLSEAVGPDGKKLFESKEEAARFIAKMRALNGNRLSSIKGGGSSQKNAIQLNITNQVVSNMPRKPFIVDTHPIPYQY